MQPSHWARHVLRTDLGQSCSQRGTTGIQVALLEGLGCARRAQVGHKLDPCWDPSSPSWAQHGATWPKLGFGAEAANKEPHCFFFSRMKFHSGSFHLETSSSIITLNQDRSTCRRLWTLSGHIKTSKEVFQYVVKDPTTRQD